MGNNCRGLRRVGNAAFNVYGYVDDLKSSIGTLTGPPIKDGHGQATCILIHKDWLLTTHITLPSPGPAFDCIVTFNHNGVDVRRKLNPRRLVRALSMNLPTITHEFRKLIWSCI